MIKVDEDHGEIMGGGHGNSKGKLRDRCEWRRGGPWVRVCHGIDRALIKLNAVNIHRPNRSKQEGKRSSWRLWDIGTARSPSRNMVSTGVFY